MDAILQTVTELATSDPYYLAVEKILKSYDTSKSTADNKEMLESSFSKEQLNSVVYFTKTLETQYPAIVQRISLRKSRNKSNLAGDIAILMNGINPIKCLQCDEDYIHTTAENTENNSFSCMLCNRYSHKSCYQNSDVKPGFFFICAVCISKYNEKSNLTKANDTPLSPQLKSKDDENKSESISSTNTESTVHPYQTPKPKRPVQDIEKDDKWCPLYLQGTCPHGISGRGCSYTHPRRCSYYSKYGDDRWRGCRYGKNCKFFHPKLCLNSVQLKMCLTKSCRDVHLAGTRRFKPRQEKHSQSSQHSQNAPSYGEQRQRQQTNYISPWQENLHGENSPWQENQHRRNPVSPWQPPITSPPSQPRDSERNQDFLVKYLENMRADLTKTIENKIETALNAQKQITENPRKPEPQIVNSGASHPPPPPSNPNNHQKPLLEEPIIETQNFNQIPVNQHLPPNPFQLQPFAHLPQLPNLLHPHLNLSQNPIPQLHI